MPGILRIPYSLLRFPTTCDALRVVAGMVLIVVLAAVAVPGSVGSRGPSPEHAIDQTLFRGVEVSSTRGTEMTTPALDPAYRSDGALDETSILLDPDQQPAPAGRPDAATVQPARPPGRRDTHVALDGNVCWYGPGFYGKRTACGYALTQSIVGVAHRTLPCGTKVTFRNPANGRVGHGPRRRPRSVRRRAGSGT